MQPVTEAPTMNERPAQDHARHQELIERWIEPNPYRPGPDNVRVRDYGVPVWALVGHALATRRPPEQVASDYAIPPEAAEAALAYYRVNQQVIEARLKANAA